MMRILITGGSGFLGRHFTTYLQDKSKNAYEIYPTYYLHDKKECRHPNALYLDITDKKQVMDVIVNISPDVIIHTAAMTDFNTCALRQDLAYQVNVLGTEQVAFASRNVGARFFYLSTDLVFDGNSSFVTEKESPRPCCNYGKTKLSGEEKVLKLLDNPVILRTALMYGFSLNRSITFSEGLVKNFRDGKRVQLFTDEYRTPLYVKDYCQILDELIQDSKKQGIFHLAGNERISRYEFGIMVTEIFGFKKDLIMPVSLKDITFKDSRPKDCSMDNSLVSSLIKTKVGTVFDGLRDMHDQYNTY